MYFPFILSLYLILGFIKTDEINYIKQLRTLLLKPSNYDRFVRPVMQPNKTVKVAFGLIITQILELDLIRDILTTDAIIHMKWIDEYVKWDPNKYGNVSKIRFNYDELWKPELEIWNSGISIFPRDQYASDSEIIALSNGTIYWMSPITLCSFCNFKLREWPYDNQECVIVIGIKDYNSTEVQFVGKTSLNKTVLGPWAKNNEYTVYGVTSRIETLNFYGYFKYSTFQIELKLKRRFTNYSYFFVLPYFLSIIFCILMFKFQIYSGQRILFAFISIILDLKIIYIISSRIGLKTYHTPVIVKHIGFNLALIGLLLILSISIRVNISFLYSNIRWFRNLNDSFLSRFLLISPSEIIENDLIQMIKNNQYNKLVRIDRQMLNKFSSLIQFADRLVILFYCLISIFMYFFIF